ncbi:MAG: heme b synthase [Desulfobacteraceae bacterium]|nr:MAG: heme b synthase [Desulfobacteraceae bacterium]
MMKDIKSDPSNAYPLRLVAWELTRTCNLSCIHCRAAAGRGPYSGEWSTDQSLIFLDQIAHIGKPIVILTGGEPLLRSDLFEIASYGAQLGLRMVLATNGTLLTPDKVKQIQSAGIQRVSISLDGATPAEHDRFRKVPGAFQNAVRGVELLRTAGIPFQINTTITRQNAGNIQDILERVIALGAVAHHIFLLVPTGRAKEMRDQEIEAQDYEKLLHWFYGKSREIPLHLKATCAPHYYRVLRQEAHRKGEEVNFDTYGLDAVTRGCLGGTGFAFIAYDGRVQPCGYLELDCGNVRNESFVSVWNNSEVFQQLRNPDLYQGKCGRCEYLKVCGGCRARAFEKTGNYLAEEPLCVYQPG